MKSRSIKIIATSALTAALSCLSVAYAEFTPYIGVDAFYLKTGIKNDQHECFSKRSKPEASLHVRAALNDTLSLELGYNRATKARKNIIDPSYDTKLKTQHVTKGPYIQISGETALGNGNLFLVGGVGVTWKSFGIKIRDKETVHLRYKAHDEKLIPLASVGFRYKMQDRVSLRMLAMWENTSKLKCDLAKGLVDLYGTDTVKHKNSLKFGVGIEYAL